MGKAKGAIAQPKTEMLGGFIPIVETMSFLA
jgi:hypothetical protein